MKIKIKCRCPPGQADPTWDALFKPSLPIIVVPD
jgi:hypothetical protein